MPYTVQDRYSASTFTGCAVERLKKDAMALAAQRRQGMQQRLSGPLTRKQFTEDGEGGKIEHLQLVRKDGEVVYEAVVSASPRRSST